MEATSIYQNKLVRSAIERAIDEILKDILPDWKKDYAKFGKSFILDRYSYAVKSKPHYKDLCEYFLVY